MSPLAHAQASFAARRRWQDVVVGMLPDVANLTFLWEHEWVSEDDVRVRASRILHSPVTVVIVLLLTRGRWWPYALHWLMDVPVHAPHQVFWPFVKEKRSWK